MTDLEVYVRARYPLLYLVTPEEERALASLHALADGLGKQVVAWSYTEGLGGEAGLRDPLGALEAVRLAETRHLYVFKDLHPFFNNPAVVRKLRDLAQALRSSAKALVLVSPVLSVPPELTKDVTLVDFPPPDHAMVLQLINRAGQMAGRPVELDKFQLERLAAAARGLTAGEIANGLAKALVVNRGLNEQTIALMAEEKRHVVRKTGVLEYFDHPEALAAVGGLDNLKAWLGKRQHAFEQRARDFGLPEPRGLLLVGVQGCGKSLVAKAVAGLWGLPLLRLDVGRLMSGLVGASEENIRAALKTAEALGPVVLWVDEIEKGFAGSQGAGDSGTAARVLATFLTWLQEKEAPVFVIATANHLDLLPPELARKGRFDEIFFVDLPDPQERQAIWEIHLRKRKRHLPDFDLPALVAASDGMSGAEIEQALIDGLYDAFDQGRPLRDADLLAALGRMVPMSRALSTELDRLRAWAREKARPATAPRTLEALEPEWSTP